LQQLESKHPELSTLSAHLPSWAQLHLYRCIHLAGLIESRPRLPVAEYLGLAALADVETSCLPEQDWFERSLRCIERLLIGCEGISRLISDE
jgi:hypothetical protein